MLKFEVDSDKLRNAVEKMNREELLRLQGRVLRAREQRLSAVAQGDAAGMALTEFLLREAEANLLMEQVRQEVEGSG